MATAEDIGNLIRIKNRRLQILKEQEALQGISADPSILIQIEDLESEIRTLTAQLAGAQYEWKPGSDQAGDPLVVTPSLTPLPQQSEDPVSQGVKVLFVAANPRDTVRLRLDEEIRTIEERIRSAPLRDTIRLDSVWAVRATDLQALLLRHRPNIVHFSGHGSDVCGLVLEDSDGNSQLVSIRALRSLFSILKDEIRCVILDACYSEELAQAIAEHIAVVIGMSESLSDRAARSFSSAFYQAIAFGRDMQTAFDLGCSQMDLDGHSEHEVPRLIALNVTPKDIVLVGL